MKSIILFVVACICSTTTPAQIKIQSYKIDIGKFDSVNNKWSFSKPIPSNIVTYISDKSITIYDTDTTTVSIINSEITDKEQYNTIQYSGNDNNGNPSFISFTHYKKYNLHTIDVVLKDRCFVLFITEPFDFNTILIAPTK